jgi:hypothetical protein
MLVLTSVYTVGACTAATYQLQLMGLSDLVGCNSPPLVLAWCRSSWLYVCFDRVGGFRPNLYIHRGQRNWTSSTCEGLTQGSNKVLSNPLLRYYTVGRLLQRSFVTLQRQASIVHTD